MFGELSTVGYPPRDLLEDPELIAENVAAVEAIAEDCRGVAALLGYVRPAATGPGPPLEDAAALLFDGKIQDVCVKSLLPNYDVYDDPRYFRPGAGPTCTTFNGRQLGVTICEDLWDAVALGRSLYTVDPIAQLTARAAPEVILNIAASGYERGKVARREALFARQARRSGAAIVYVNQVGGNDSMVFDGSSCAVSPDGTLLARAASFREDLLLIDTSAAAGRCEPLDDEIARLNEALRLGLRDYVGKGGFPGVGLWLGGDLASAVVAVLAVDALGPERVFAAAMPGGSGNPSLKNVGARLAENLGVKLHVPSVERMLKASRSLLEGTPGGPAEGAEVPARLPWAIMSLLAGAHRWVPLVPTTKTDLAVGRWEPLAGAVAPLGDLFSRDLTGLAKQLNAAGERIPRELVGTWKSARRTGGASPQDDSGSDERVDEILSRHVEQGQTAAEIVRGGLDGRLVERTLHRLYNAEHRRRQAPMVLQVSGRAFGLGRRIPTARRFPSGGSRQ